MTPDLAAAIEDAKSVKEHLEIFGGENLRIRNTNLFITTLDALIQSAQNAEGLVRVLEEIVSDCEADYPPSHKIMRHAGIKAINAYRGDKP